MHLIRFAPLAAILLAGCAAQVTRAPVPAYAVARVIPMGNPQACSLILHRGQAIVGRTQADAPVLYVDQQPIAPVKAGDSVCVEIIDGTHNILMQERRLGIPVGFSKPLPYTFPRAQPLYLRYGQAVVGKRVTNVFIESSAEQVKTR